VVSVHDFFLVCPATQLLDEDRVFCGGACTPGVGRCLSVMPWLRDVGRFKGAVVERHRAGLAPHLEQAEAWITTSEWTREIVTAVYPGLRHRRWEVIEHGRDFPEQRVVRRPPRPDRPVGLVTIGHIGPHKGENELLELMRLDAGSGTRLRLTVLGTCGPRLRRYAEVTGPFDRGDLPSLVERAAPSFSLLLSPWGETYSHALTESWSCGVPAIVPDIGALAARVRAHGGGWVLRDPSPERLLGEIERIARDADEYDRVSCEAHTRDLPSVADMGRSYARIFRDVLDAGR
jgi:glycosyltransferase involved in cell wall biosynthesis